MLETNFIDTEIGSVPADWLVVTLGEEMTFFSNNTLSRDNLSEIGQVKNVHYGDVLIKYGSVLNASSDKFTYIDLNKTRLKLTHIAKDGDIIMADTAEDETVCKSTELINVGNDKIVSGLHTMWMRPKEGDFAPKFLGYFINSKVFHNQVLPLIQGIKVSSVSKSAIKNTFLLLPPLPEQRRIASALTSIDGLISALDNLIRKKQAIKIGTMQELLSGKRRLEGFNKPWVNSRISDLYTVTRGYVLAMGNVRSIRSSAFPYPVYSSQTKNSGIAGYYSDYLYEDAITWTTDGANAGDMNFRKGLFYCTNVCGVLLSDSGMANYCMAKIIGLVSKSHVSYVGNPKLMNNTMSEIKIYHPSDVKE